MKTFEDSTGHAWKISLTFGDVLRVKSESDGKFDLLAPDATEEDKSETLQERLWKDLALFWELLFHLVKPQLDEHNRPYERQLAALSGKDYEAPVAERDKLQAAMIDAVEFGRRMGPECLVEARQAFFAEWTDFFLKLQRPEVAKALETMRTLQQKLEAKVRERLSSAEMVETTKKIETEMDKRLNQSFGALPDTVASILSREPGVN